MKFAVLSIFIFALNVFAGPQPAATVQSIVKSVAAGNLTTALAELELISKFSAEQLGAGLLAMTEPANESTNPFEHSNQIIEAKSAAEIIVDIIIREGDLISLAKAAESDNEYIADATLKKLRELVLINSDLVMILNIHWDLDLKAEFIGELLEAATEKDLEVETKGRGPLSRAILGLGARIETMPFVAAFAEFGTSARGRKIAQAMVMREHPKTRNQFGLSYSDICDALKIP